LLMSVAKENLRKKEREKKIHENTIIREKEN
jgi:hypothetical protein